MNDHQPSGTPEPELYELHRQACEMLARLDRLSLYHAGAHLSMTIDLLEKRLRKGQSIQDADT